MIEGQVMASSVQNPAGKKAMQEGAQRTRVIKPDAGQIYHVDAPKEAIASVSVVDVDVVIRLTNGETIVLAEAGLAAMSGGNIQVHYTNGSAPISDLFNQTGLANIPVTSDLTQNIPAYSAQTKTVAKEEKTNSETPDAGGSAGVGMSSVSTTVKIDKLIEKVLQSPKITAPVVLAEIKRPEIVPMTSSSPASSKAKQEELVGSENNVLQAAFYSDSKTAQIGGIFYGGYGAKTAETNASLSAAMETNPVAGFSAGMEVRANPLNGVSFQKTMRLTYTGVTTPETI
ncbi:hypothetical protein EBR57_10905, partial [bacterium]|nr:hypothetical protein [bacterium]